MVTYASGALLWNLNKLLTAEVPVNVFGGAFAISGRGPPKDIILVTGYNKDLRNCLYSLIIKNISHIIDIP